MQQTIGRHIQRLVILGIVIALLGGAQFWLWQYIQQAAIDLHRLRTAEQQQNILTERLEEVRADRKQWEDSISQLGVIFPQEGSATQVVERLEEVADTTGVRLEVNAIEQLSPIIPKNGSGLIPIVVTLEMTAPVERLLEYIDRVEHVSEVTRIWQYALEPSGVTTAVVPSSDSLLYHLSMRVAFYLQQGT